MKSLTVRLESTTRTDLICVSCGHFLVRPPRRRDTGFVIMTRIQGEDAEGFGVHHDCIRDLKAARSRSRTTPEETQAP